MPGTMIYIGIDPGKKGGVATISDDGVKVYQWDDQRFIEDMRQHANWLDKCVAAVEKVGAMPGQGVTSMFSFGQSYGFILGVLTAFGIPYQLVSPATWKREFGLLKSQKQGSVDVCKRLFPGVNMLPTERCRKESDGMAESLLIAEYARRKM
jgi:crossover junction endodeoxyribonuclease RuvC